MLAILLLLASCAPSGPLDPPGTTPDGGSPDGGSPDGGSTTPTRALPRYAPGEADFLATPWPSDARLDADGHPDLGAFPNPAAIPLVQTYVDLAATLTGFGTNTPIYVQFEGDAPLLDLALLPTPEESCAEDSPLRLVELPSGACQPIQWAFWEEETLYLPARTLAVAPVFGFPLRPGTAHALLLDQRLAMRPASFDEDLPSLPALAPLHELLSAEQLDELAIASVFTTSDPLAGLRAARELLDPPDLSQTLRSRASYSRFTLFEGSFQAPNYLEGEAPWTEEGGLVLDQDHSADPVAWEEVRLVVATPPDLSEPPEGGWPVVIVLPGTGADAVVGCCEADRDLEPAAVMAARGMVTVSFDLPLHGERGSELAESLTVFEFPFNVLNPESGRSVQRQAAIDTMGLVRALGRSPTLTLPDGSTLPLDPERIALFGHSQGGLVLGLAAPFLDAPATTLLLSGAGGGVAITLLERTEPLEIGPLLAGVLQLPAEEEFTELHPVAGLVQWLSEVTDPINAAPFWSQRGGQWEGQPARHVMHVSGLLDTYTHHRTAEALATAGGLDVRAPAASWGEGWDLAGVEELAPPIAGNRVGFDGQAVTAVIDQWADEGHGVVFEERTAWERYGDYLAGVGGLPQVD